MRNTKNRPESFTLSLSIMWIIFSFSHFGIQLTDGWFNKLPSFRILDTTCLYLRHAVSINVLSLQERRWGRFSGATTAQARRGCGCGGGGGFEFASAAAVGLLRLGRLADLRLAQAAGAAARGGAKLSRSIPSRGSLGRDMEEVFFFVGASADLYI